MCTISPLLMEECGDECKSLLTQITVKKCYIFCVCSIVFCFCEKYYMHKIQNLEFKHL